MTETQATNSRSLNPNCSRIEAIRLADEMVTSLCAQFDWLRTPNCGVQIFDALRTEVVKVTADTMLENESTADITDGLRQLLRRFRRRALQPERITDMAPCDVLFIARRRNHLKNLMPLAEALESSDVATAIVVFDKDHLRLVESKGLVALLGPWECSVVASESERFRLLRELRRGWRHNMADAYVNAVFERSAEMMGELIRADAFATELVEGLCPKVVVVGNPHTYESRLVVSAAEKRGVKTVAVQHGDISTNDPSWSYRRTDATFVWGNISRDVLIANGHSESSIHVVGKLSKGARSSETVDVEDDMTSEAVSDIPEVLVTLSGAGHMVGLREHLHDVQVLATAAVGSSYRWNFRLHSKDDPKFYTILEERGFQDRIRVTGVYDEPIEAALGRAKALITVSSTTAIEAMGMGIPVVTLGYGARPVPHFAQHGETAHVEGTPAGVVSALEEIFSRDARAETDVMAQVERANEFAKDYWFRPTKTKSADALIRGYLSPCSSLEEPPHGKSNPRHGDVDPPPIGVDSEQTTSQELLRAVKTAEGVRRGAERFMGVATQTVVAPLGCANAEMEKMK